MALPEGLDHGKAYWVYWAMASLAAAAVGGLLLPLFLRHDPFSLRAPA